MTKLASVLDEIEEYLDHRQDTRDGGDGVPLPNEEMSLLRDLVEARTAWAREGLHDGPQWRPTDAKYSDPLAWRSNVTGKVYVTCVGEDGKTYQTEIDAPHAKSNGPSTATGEPAT